MGTYVVSDGVLEFVLVIVVEDYAVLVQEREDRSLPTGRTQEVQYQIEEPFLEMI